MLDEPPSPPRLRAASAARPPQASSAPVPSASLPPPRFQHIRLPDLQDIDRLLTLYGQAVQIQVIGSAEADRLTFVALAQHVLPFRPQNPGGLFLQLLRQRRFAVITQAEEDQARQRLTTYLYARPEDTRRRSTA